MPRGRRTSYTRDNSGRFASSPGGGAPKRSTPATRRAATRAGNRLNRDNSGRISGIGRNGATVRGGRLKTAKGNKRATQLTTLRPAGFRGGTIAKGGRGVRGMVARSLAAARKGRAGAQTAQASSMPRRVPAAQRPGSLTSTLRGTLRAVARADAARIREMEAITGQKIKPTAAGARAGTEAGARVRGTAKGGKVASTLRAGLRELAQSDARTAREMAAIVRDATPKVAGAKGGKAIRGGRAALPAGKPKPAKASAKPAKTATPVRPATSNRPKRALAVRVGRADRADNKLAAQLKQAKASGNLKKENEIIRRRQRIDRFNKTYNFADLKASRKALAPDKPTAPKRTRSARPAGTVAKPRGMKPGVLAASRARKKMNEIEAERIRINNMPTMNEAKVKALLAANHAVFVYPRRKEVRVDGGKAVKVSKKMAQKLSKVVKGSTRKP